ncbi:hypothetical protein PMN64_00500 [Bradyrhizobium sp. UFLA01-814]|uniref:hypothetical protein n=1 Tax=Bradyrhizobium sp. UFLA01-814 TaxID=3023480 RepID=UPI00398B26B3
MKNAPVATKGLLLKELSRRAYSKHGDNTIERIVLEHGVPFTGIDRPKGMRLRKAQYCFRNSFYAASEQPGMLYVEGFAAVANSVVVHHGWISPDGVHAIDVTLRYPPESIEFFGVAFTVGTATSELLQTNQLMPLFNSWKPGSRLLVLAEKAAKSPAPTGPGVSGP